MDADQFTAQTRAAKATQFAAEIRRNNPNPPGVIRRYPHFGPNSYRPSRTFGRNSITARSSDRTTRSNIIAATFEGKKVAIVFTLKRKWILAQDLACALHYQIEARERIADEVSLNHRRYLMEFTRTQNQTGNPLDPQMLFICEDALATIEAQKPSLEMVKFRQFLGTVANPTVSRRSSMSLTPTPYNLIPYGSSVSLRNSFSNPIAQPTIDDLITLDPPPRPSQLVERSGSVCNEQAVPFPSWSASPYATVQPTRTEQVDPPAVPLINLDYLNQSAEINPHPVADSVDSDAVKIEYRPLGDCLMLVSVIEAPGIYLLTRNLRHTITELFATSCAVNFGIPAAMRFHMARLGVGDEQITLEFVSMFHCHEAIRAEAEIQKQFEAIGISRDATLGSRKLHGAIEIVEPNTLDTVTQIIRAEINALTPKIAVEDELKFAEHRTKQKKYELLMAHPDLADAVKTSREETLNV